MINPFKSKKGLGRGLSSLIGDSEKIEDKKNVSISSLVRNKYQPRKKFNWSHPIVFYTGKKVGWDILNERDTKETFTLFKNTFISFKKEAQKGKRFSIQNNENKKTLKPFNKSLFKKLRNKHKV